MCNSQHGRKCLTHFLLFHFVKTQADLGILKHVPTLMLFLKMYPGREKPFFLSIGSLKMTSCSNRKTLLSFARDRKLLSCSVTVKVSCWSSLPWAVILPWYHSKDKHNKQRKRLRCGFHGLNSWHEKCFEDYEGWSEFLRCTSKPCSLPTFIMSLQRFGTKHITSTAFCLKEQRRVCFQEY